MAVEAFTENTLRPIAETLAEAVSHKELTDLLRSCSIPEQGGNPKWERMLLALRNKQVQDRCGNNVAAFLQAVMDPVRFVNRGEAYEEFRLQLNTLLAFAGLQLGPNGRLQKAVPAETLSEAQERAGRLRSELARRHVHPDVLQFCRAELLEENYFHAILEATKSVADKLRVRTGLGSDGAELVDKALSVSHPLLALSALTTDTETSEQKGFGNLLKGMFGMFRNPTAHGPRIRRTYTEQEAIDLLTMVSFMHRMIDSAVRTPFTP